MDVFPHFPHDSFGVSAAGLAFPGGKDFDGRGQTSCDRYGYHALNALFHPHSFPFIPVAALPRRCR